MRKLVMALVLGVSAGALAQDGGTKKSDARTDLGAALHTGTHKIQELERKVRGTDGGSGSAQGAPSEKELSQAFDLKGTVKSPSAAFLTVQREGLPAASLSVRDRTQVTLDGKPVDVKDLPEGAQVRAKFQLEGEEPVALRIEAKAVKKAPESNAGKPDAGGSTP